MAMQQRKQMEYHWHTSAVCVFFVDFTQTSLSRPTPEITRPLRTYQSLSRVLRAERIK
jgi:hypothetical protein